MLKQRLRTALALIVVLLGVVIFSKDAPILFFAVGNCFVILGMREFTAMTGGIGWIGVLGGVLVFSSSFIAAAGAGFIPPHFQAFANPEWMPFSIFVSIAGLFLFEATRREHQGSAGRICSTLGGILYVSWLLAFLPRINYYASARFPELDGRMYVFFLFLVVKVTDSAAYFIGSSWGRHKLIERLSPKKTVEGALGGVIFGGASALGGKYLFSLSEISAAGALTLGFLLGATAVGADLAESLLKRSTGRKDSGNSLPGLGGILDLMDSIFFTAPFLFLYMKLILKL